MNIYELEEKLQKGENLSSKELNKLWEEHINGNIGNQIEEYLKRHRK